jgi:PAS domain S-box-containing protein
VTPVTQRPARGAARLAAILDSLPDALLLVDMRGLVVNANARALEMFETQAGPLVGRALTELVPGFDRTKAAGRSRRRKERRGERGKPERYSARQTDGSSFACDVSTSLLSGTAEDELLVVVVRRLDDQIESSAEMTRQHKQTETILRATSEAIIGVDNNGKIVLANPAAARMLKTKATELAGKDLHDLAHHSRPDGSPYPRSSSPLIETLRTGKRTKSREEILWRRDGSQILVEMSTSPVMENETLTGAIVAYVDRGDLLVAKRRREELVHVLRRELGRPLGRARNDIARVAASEYGPVSPEAAGALDEIAAGFDRLIRVISQALDQDRSEPSRAAFTQRADALKLVQLAVDAVTPAVDDAGVFVSVDADPIEIDIDEERLVQALATVLSSAARSAPPQSTVTITAKQRGDRLRIVVRGTGTGMPPRIVERPAGSSTAIDVGVPVAQRLVDQLGGSMTVYSSPADGTSCTIELPMNVRSVEPQSGGPAPPAIIPPQDLPEGDADLAEPAGDVDLPDLPDLPTVETPAPAATVAEAAGRTVTEEPQPADSAPGAGASIPGPSRPQEPEYAPSAQAASSQSAPGPQVGQAPYEMHTTLTSIPVISDSDSLPALPPTLLVWPQQHEETASALRTKGWQAVPVSTPHDLTAYLSRRPSALLVDPLTGPVTRTALQAVRNSASEAGVPLLVAAGIGEVAADALYGSDPAALLRALTPHGRKNGRPARVLLIEGDAALATAFGSRLERRGMQVIHSTSESEAVLRAAITTPDLVVVDLMLTRTSGPGIVDWLRLHDRLRETPIVTYTTTSLTADAYERLRRGDSALFLQGRAETPEVEKRITLLVERMSTTI